MNILQIHKFFWKRDGASRYMLELSELLHGQGHNVIPFSTNHPDNLPSPYSKYFVPYRDLSGSRQLSVKDKIAALDHFIYSHEAKVAMESMLKKEANVSVAHVHNIYHHITPSILPVLKKKGIKVVMTLHDYKLFSPNYSMYHHDKIQTKDAKYWYLNCIANKCINDSYTKSALVTAEMIFQHKIMRYYDKYVDHFIAPSVFIKELFIKSGWPADKITHIANPAFDISHSNFSDGEYVAYIGSIIKQKGLQTLLEAAKQLPEIPFKCIGTGKDQGEFTAYVKKHHIKNVAFTGFQTGKTLKSLLQRARIVALPSVWYENYPLSILEAKMAQKVVIGSDIGGIPEMLPKELLVAPGDPNMLASKIKAWYVADKDKRKTMGKHLRAQTLADNDPTDHVKRMISLYQSV